MEARGFGTAAQAAVAAAIRVVHNSIGALFAIWVLVGIDAYTGTYDRLFGFLPFLPEGRTGALIGTIFVLLGWTVFASIIQAAVYRRGLTRWPADVPGADAVAPPDAGEAPQEAAEPPAVHRGRFDPRAVVVAAFIAFAVLLSGTHWPASARSPPG
jgi:hypothetical protein